jgi:hypothetical protein
VLGVFAVAASAILVFHIRRLRRPRQLHYGMAPGGILNVDNSPGVSPEVESHHRGPSGSDRSLPNWQGNGEEVHAVRQMEIGKRLRAAQRAMDLLTAAQRAQPDSDRVPTPGPLQQEVASLRNQMQELQNTIEQMRNQQQSDGALGLSDEPPPAY